MKTINIKGKAYVEVNERIKYFRKEYPEWSLITEIIKLENGFCLVKASAIDENDNVRATGHAYENENSSRINQTSYIENCETSAVGRCLGVLGIGIDTSIASAEEVLNAITNQETKNEPKELTQSIDEYKTDMDLISTLEDLKAYASGIKDQINSNKELNKIYWDRFEELQNEAKGEAKASKQ